VTLFVRDVRLCAFLVSNPIFGSGQDIVLVNLPRTFPIYRWPVIAGDTPSSGAH
jgi:hypothetical protein